jgi:hypothetical protein
MSAGHEVVCRGDSHQPLIDVSGAAELCFGPTGIIRMQRLGELKVSSLHFSFGGTAGQLQAVVQLSDSEALDS